MSSNNNSNNQENISVQLEELSAARKSQKGEFNSRFDEIVKLLRKNQGRQSIEDEGKSNHWRQSLMRPYEGRGNFIIQGRNPVELVYRSAGVGRFANFPQPNVVTKKVRIEVADFYGKWNPKEFFDWLMSMKDYFEWNHVPDNIKVWFVKMKLKGDARFWWYSVEERLHKTHKL